MFISKRFSSGPEIEDLEDQRRERVLLDREEYESLLNEIGEVRQLKNDLILGTHTSQKVPDQSKETIRELIAKQVNEILADVRTSKRSISFKDIEEDKIYHTNGTTIKEKSDDIKGNDDFDVNPQNSRLKSDHGDRVSDFVHVPSRRTKMDFIGGKRNTSNGFVEESGQFQGILNSSDSKDSKITDLTTSTRRTRRSVLSNHPSFGNDHSDVLEDLSQDTFSMMMLRAPFNKIHINMCGRTVSFWFLSPTWLFGLLAFSIQVILGVLIPLDELKLQYGSATSDSPVNSVSFNVPIRVKSIVSVAQFFSIILAFMTQTDLYESLRCILLLRYSRDSVWFEYLDIPRSFGVWVVRVFLPNFLKFFQGCLILFTTFVIIVQSANVVDLLKDFTALFIISSADDFFWFAAYQNVVGKELSEAALDCRKVKIINHGMGKFLKRVLQSMMIILLGGMLAGMGVVYNGQKTGAYIDIFYPICQSVIEEFNNAYSLDGNESYSKKNVGDGTCDKFLNNPECEFDGGDCIDFNTKYPECDVFKPSFIGDGTCYDAGKYNTLECGYDGGDCFLSEYPQCHGVKGERFDPSMVKNEKCDGHPYDTEVCGWDGGACVKYAFGKGARYEGCKTESPWELGDSLCQNHLNTAECEWDGGDCIDFNDDYPNCVTDSPWIINDGICQNSTIEDGKNGCGNDCDEFLKRNKGCSVDFPYLLGDGKCQGFPYYSKSCGFDAGDCEIFVNRFPGCKNILETIEEPYKGWTVHDKICTPTLYNLDDACNYDISHCKAFLEEYPNCPLRNEENMGNIGDGICDDFYNIEECGFDYGDCKYKQQYPNCDAYDLLGNDQCDGAANNEDCAFDNGECTDFNDSYPNCQVPDPWRIGNGWCDSWMEGYLSDECGNDGGDCNELLEVEETCEVRNRNKLGNGKCNGGLFNTEACNWDEGDCDSCNAIVEDISKIGDGVCDGTPYNSPECNNDGGDCRQQNDHDDVPDSPPDSPPNSPPDSPPNSPPE
ncbi:hypothetical protein CTEN210_08260 [Chaetoceros tenuissimus]|uniref:LNR domain-containing protein n=1 Tax=Chaetoceros tenuissimus TaxID=426638 RepID=A0AAD3H6J7_9STRA|nr:hypothetical protein CTEN210_08260 [Chaetoceros tenuissimus]